MSADTAIEITDWQPAGVKRCIAASSRHFVGLMEDGETVLKYPHFKTTENMDALHEEADRYAHISPHENIVCFKGVHDDGLLFEYCEREHLAYAISNGLSTDQKVSLAKHTVRGLIHLHRLRFIHCDLNVHNVFVTRDFQARIGDLQGQLYGPDGEIVMPTMSQENAKSRHPEAHEDEFTPRTDIFALGTLLYHLWYEHSPFPDLSEYKDEEVELVQARYRRKEFPISSSKTTGWYDIILGCWLSTFTDATEVLAAIEALRDGTPEDTSAPSSVRSRVMDKARELAAYLSTAIR